MKTAIINFSGRPGGNCHDIAKAVAEFLPAGGEIVFEEMCNRKISPCGDCGYECFDENKKCPRIGDGVWALYHSVCLSSTAYYVVPNYCDYPCAHFFIFNERSQCYFQRQPALTAQYLNVHKKFIVVSNTESDHFARAFKYHVAREVEPDILFLAARKFGKVSIDGGLLSAEGARFMVKDYTGR